MKAWIYVEDEDLTFRLCTSDVKPVPDALEIDSEFIQNVADLVNYCVSVEPMLRTHYEGKAQSLTDRYRKVGNALGFKDSK